MKYTTENIDKLRYSSKTNKWYNNRTAYILIGQEKNLLKKI